MKLCNIDTPSKFSIECHTIEEAKAVGEIIGMSIETINMAWDDYRKGVRLYANGWNYSNQNYTEEDQTIVQAKDFIAANTESDINTYQIF